MKHQHSKIGKYGLRWKPVEGYKIKKGKKIPTPKPTNSKTHLVVVL